MISIAVQDAIRASLLAPFGVRLVLEPSAACVPELESLFLINFWRQRLFLVAGKIINDRFD